MQSVIAIKAADGSVAPSQSEISDILHTIFTAPKSQTSLDASYALVNVLATTVGARGLKLYSVLETIQKAATDKKDAGRREGAMFAMGAMFEKFPTEHPLSEVVFLVQNEKSVHITLDALADKGSAVRDSAQYALDALYANLKPEAMAVGLMPVLMKYLSKPTGKWQGTVGAFALVGKMAEKAKIGNGSKEEENGKAVLREALGKRLEGLIPVVEGGMHDLKSEVCISTRIVREPTNTVIGCQASHQDNEFGHYSTPER
jgi:elongation factor 3